MGYLSQRPPQPKNTRALDTICPQYRLYPVFQTSLENINRLTGRSPTKKVCPNHPDSIVKRVVNNGITKNLGKVSTLNKMKELKHQYSVNTEEHAYLQDPITLDEVNVALEHTKPGKAPGPDGIHNEFLIHAGKKIIIWLTNFINKLFCLEVMPRMWRRASIIAILKPGKDSKLRQSYRPISLLCTSYKLLERIVLNRIYPIAGPCLTKQQAGFRHGKSTVDQVRRLTQNIELVFNNKIVCGAVFLDLTSACDTVWHKGLHLKLLKVIKCKKMTNFIMELLYTRTFLLVTSDGQKSRLHRLKNGVPQGSVLAPTCITSIRRTSPQQLLIGTCMQTTLL